MSGRFKRHLSKAGSSADPNNRGPSGSFARKKRKLDGNSSEDDEKSFWYPKHLGDLKAYNRSATEPPAELIRKDLISAMKLADNEPLEDDDFWGISDQWKQEWEKGVQVPVSPNSLPEPSVIQLKEYPRPPGDFRLPRRYIRVTHNDFFNNEKHVLSNVPTKAEKMCRYDMDNLDDGWLEAYNGERARMGAEPVPLAIFELIIEHFEETCWENINKLLKTEESLSLEYDEDVICDVCRSPDSEDGNEMVFCDNCNICVHQACYGITAIPSGPWLCRTCYLGIKPNCVLCPNKGGSMKSNKSNHKWAHVACALWIPEVSIGSVERMEPITKINTIPQSRWALVCVLCRERWGACIQCSVKSCKTAYHVTCAFKHGLEMKAIVEDEDTDEVKLRSYCEKHSRTSKKDGSDTDSDGGTNSHKKKKERTNEQKNQARAAQLRKIEAEFYKHVDVLQTSTVLDIDLETTESIFYYWKLKRKGIFNKPLLTPRSQELDLLSQQQEQDIEKMKMFVQLRQYLERVRNLCYMVSRREKMSRTFCKTREQTFYKQDSLLSNASLCLNSQERDAVLQANHSSSIYDRMYSHVSAPVHSHKEFDKIIKLIAGTYKTKSKLKELVPEVKEKPKIKREKDVNGLVKKPPPHSLVIKKDNPYRKTYVNGAEQRRSRSKSMSHGSTDTSSAEDSDSSLASIKWKPPEPGSRLSVYTSSEDDILLKSSDKSRQAFEFSNRSRNDTMDTTDDEDIKSKSKEKLSKISPQRSVRGRGGARRGRGRPPRTPRAELHVKEAVASSEEEKVDKLQSFVRDPKAFDALIKGNIKTSLSDTLLIEKKERKPFTDSSDDDLELPKPTRGKTRRKLEIKKEPPVSSSEEDTIKITPSKRGRKGRGRGRSRGSNVYSSLYPNPSSPNQKLSDDELGPAIYKLTSEEEESKSDTSVNNNNRTEVVNSEKSEFGSDNDGPIKKEAKLKTSDGSDSDGPHSERDVKDLTSDSYNHSHMKTKAAMKEFTPKLEMKLEKLKKNDKASSKSKRLERNKSDSKGLKAAINVDTKTLEAETVPPDLSLFVPQRAAAKKASELITSQNTGAPVIQNNQEIEMKKSSGRSSKEPSSELESISSLTDEHLKKSPLKNRRNKSSKERTSEEPKVDCVEPPKKNIFEPPEILPYVPIREAARKAAENFKAGGTKAISTPTVPEDSDSSPTKLKKNKAESKPCLRTRTKSPRNSAKAISATSESETEQENLGSYSPLNKKNNREFLEIKEKSRSIFSESEDEPLLSPKKDRQSNERLTEDGKELPHKQQLFRGDIFKYNHQSSSENDDEKGLTAEKGISCKADRNKNDYSQQKPSSEERRRSKSFRNSRALSRSTTYNQQDDEHEAENEEPAVETRRKAPDKKLKTSDGRPEHGFQPPVTSRNEPRIPLDKQSNEILSSESSPEKDDSLLCESGPQCRSRVASGDISKKNLRSNLNATSPTTEQKGKESERESSVEPMDTGKAKISKEVLSRNAISRHFEEKRGKVQSEEAGIISNHTTPKKTSPEKGFKSTFECISTQEEKTLENDHKVSGTNSGSIFNFNEKEVEVKRLDDIEEIDTENESKKDKIFDSDEEGSVLGHGDSKVEQPKDSGYKSAIATPEPIERLQSLTTESDNKPILSNYESSDSLITPKKIFPHLDIEGTSIPNKYISPGRRKNLEDVIEERKKHAESELMASLENQRNSSVLPSSRNRPLSIDTYPDRLESAAISKEPPKTECNSDSLSGTSPFVDKWREQWDNSPSEPNVQLNHNESSTNYPPQTHHPGLNNMGDFSRYLEMPNAYQGYMSQFPLRFLSMYGCSLPPLHNNPSLGMQNHEEFTRKIHAAAHLESSSHSEMPPNRNALLHPEDKNLTFSSNNGLLEVTPTSTHTSRLHSPIADMQNSDITSDLHKKISPLSKSSVSDLSTIEPRSIAMSPPPPCRPPSVSPEISVSNEISHCVKESVSPSTGISTAISQNISPTSTITTTSSKISTFPQVSPGRVVSSPAKASPRLLVSDNQTNTQTVYTSISGVSVSSLHTSVTSIHTSPSKTPVSSHPVSSVTSPIPSVGSPPLSNKEDVSPKSNLLEFSEDRIMKSPEQKQKRVPIYMQEPKTPTYEKRSPRTQAVSPRWGKEKRERKTKSSRKYQNKGARGRGTNRGRGRGYHSPRFSSVSVPKELVGTVYEFDDDFDDDGPANNTLDDLRMLREKRQSVDTTPQQSYTPTYSFEREVLPVKKSGKERKTRVKDKKVETTDEVSKILEDYKNKQNSTLKRGVVEPSPPQQSEPYSNDKIESSFESPTRDPLALDEDKEVPADPLELPNDESAKIDPIAPCDSNKDDLNSSFPSAVAKTPDDGTNQLRFKIKGPYAKNYLLNNLSTSQPQAPTNPAPSSTTSSLRRMRKKELILQYCRTNTDQPDNSSSNNSHNPMKINVITIPKAMASFTIMPTREDYKMYTQDDSNTRSSSSANSRRNRRQPRESKQPDWRLIDESKGAKRNCESTSESGRKRARNAKEAKGQEDKDLSSGKLRISIGKNTSDTAVAQLPAKDLSSKGKPPKKRHPDPFTKVMNDNLKYREEIMAEFDKKSAENSKSTSEKKSRKRRLALDDDGNGSSPASELVNDNQDLKVIANEASNKLVLKISKNKYDRNSEGRLSGKEDSSKSSGKEDSTLNRFPHPLKIRLSLSKSASLSKSDSSSAVVTDNKNESSEKVSEKNEPAKIIMPLKIKLQRGPAGYTTSKNSKEDKSSYISNNGPGPPPQPPEPPDPTRGHFPPHKEAPPSPPKDPPVANFKNSYKNIETNSQSFSSSNLIRPGLSDEVFERLEAHLAATDGAPTTAGPALSVPPTFSSLQPVPALKDDSGFR